MKRLHGKVGIYDVYIDDVFYKTAVLDVVIKEFEVSRGTANKKVFRYNGKVVSLEKIGSVIDFLEYSVYRGDELLAIGTTEELMEILKIKRSTLNTYKYRKKVQGNTYCDCIGFNEDELGEVDLGDYSI